MEIENVVDSTSAIVKETNDWFVIIKHLYELYGPFKSAKEAEIWTNNLISKHRYQCIITQTTNRNKL